MWLQTFFLLILFSSITAARRGGSSHSYPSSYGRSGTGLGGGTPAHTYPHSTSMSGNSGNTHVQRTYTQQNNYVHKTEVNHHKTQISHHKTEVHHHYHYNPPQQITYGSTYHPVYHAPPPLYVYEYRDSGSRFDNLLTGLALYNLGRMSANHNHDSRREYRSSSNEICKLGISKQNGEYEETRIDCKLMSSFIWEMESQPTNQQVVSTNTVTTTVVQSTSNSTGTRTETKTVVDALQVKGPSIQVTKGMDCFMIRISTDSSILKKKVECGLLQAYAQNSLSYSNNNNLLFPCSATVVFFVIFIIH